MLKINETYKKLALSLPKSIINGESRLIVGFSGGPDSRFLVDFLRSVINNPINPRSNGIQEKARKIRLNIFCELSKKYKTPYIFLGHNFNDHAETIFFNIIRGSGYKGLEGIKSYKKIIIKEHTLFLMRPLIELTKNTIKNL